jgi:hypothetical protein
MNNDRIPLHADLVQTPAKIFAFLSISIAVYAAAATIESAILHGLAFTHPLILLALLTQILLLHRLGLACKQVYRTDQGLVIRAFQHERRIPWSNVQQLRVPWWGGVAKWRIHELTLQGNEKIYFYAATEHVRHSLTKPETQSSDTQTPRPTARTSSRCSAHPRPHCPASAP